MTDQSTFRTLRFYGASDDLVEIEGTKGGEPDEVGCYGSAGLSFEVKTGDGRGLVVSVSYALPGRGCWLVGICPLDEDVPLPDWPMRWSLSERGYSTQLEIDVPATACVSQMGGES